MAHDPSNLSAHRPVPDLTSDGPVSTPVFIFLLASWCSVGLAVAANYGTFSQTAEISITAAAGFALAAGIGRRQSAPPVGMALLLTLVVCIGIFLAEPTWLFISATALHAVTALTGVALALAVTFSLTALLENRPALRLALVGAPVAASCGLVVATSAPPIDVWYMYQAASRALLHGHNFYTAHWAVGRPHQVSNEFTYLPASAVLLAPFQWIFGDVRYGLIVALVVTSVCVYRVTRGAWRWLTGSLILLFPDTPFATEQSWTDVGLLALVALTFLAVRTGRRRTGVVTLALALAFKQYAWLLLPVVAAWRPFGWRRASGTAAVGAGLCLPWALAAPSAFWRGVISFNLDLAARPDSLSWYNLLLRHGIDPGYLLIGSITGLGLALAILLVRQPDDHFPLAAAVVFLCFNLANKQTFFNQWQLEAGLVVLAVAVQLPGVQRSPLEVLRPPVG